MNNSNKRNKSRKKVKGPGYKVRTVRIRKKKKQVLTAGMVDRYHKYLFTEKWQWIRTLVASRDCFTCTRCGKECVDKEKLTGFEVHHKNYRHIYNEEEHLDDLRFLCSECHRKITRDINRGRKSSVRAGTEPKTIPLSKA